MSCRASEQYVRDGSCRSLSFTAKFIREFTISSSKRDFPLARISRILFSEHFINVKKIISNNEIRTLKYESFFYAGMSYCARRKKND